MPELMDRGDISSSDDESEDETYYPEHPMAFVEPNNEDATFVNRYEPYGTVDEVNMISIEPNMTITQRVNNGWKPNDDLETAMEQEWKEYEESMINETHETHQINETRRCSTPLKQSYSPIGVRTRVMPNASETYNFHQQL